MKRLAILLLALVLFLSLPVPTRAASVVRSTQRLVVNGEEVDCEKYNIDGNNYFKLRDLAWLLNGTGSQFNVEWDRINRAVSITTLRPYTTPDGTELQVGEDKSAEAQPSPQDIQLDGELCRELTAWNIGGNNYFQLRELGAVLGFDVDYDELTRTMLVTSFAGSATVLDSETDALLHANLRSAIDAILDSPTEIRHSDIPVLGETYTGKAYYVSADGDDENDGLTPETPWRSLEKVWIECTETNGPGLLQPGDAVFFRRGDVFRIEADFGGGFSIQTEGLTFSAYGEGPKPIITGSSEDGAGEEKWQLVYEDESGKRIWQYYRDMREIGMIVLNEGEAFGKRVYEFFDGEKYVSCEAVGWWMHEEVGVLLREALLPLEESMTEDLTFICRPERTSPEGNYCICGGGPLYLRCDGGNPGALYPSIEFDEYLCGPMPLFFVEASGLVFDNLSFRCNANSFFKAWYDQWEEIWNTVFQNCEFAYGGGGVSTYHIRESGAVIVEEQGDGLYTIVCNTLIRNNYFHDCISTTGTYESNGVLSFEDPGEKTDGVNAYFHFIDNVCVNTMGIRLDSTSNKLKHLDSVRVCGNQVWNTGHMDNGKIAYSEGSLITMPNCYGECLVADNVFYGTENGHPMNALLCMYIYSPETWIPGYATPEFRGNTYVQYAGRNVADFLFQGGETWSIEDPQLLLKAAKYLGETEGSFYIIEANE